MNDLLLLCFCLLSFKTSCVQSQAGSVTAFTSLCPKRVCNSTLNETEESDSCCQRCSCRPDCYKFASCCPDVITSELPEFEYPCTDLIKISNEERGMKENYVHRKHTYRLVKSCPDERSAKAYPGCSNPSSLQDFVPVSDTNYEKVFRNRHCAACHNESVSIPWLLSVACDHIASLSFETYEKRNEYILKYCQFVPVPPDVKKAELSRCYDESIVISTCLLPTQTNSYDSHLEKECLKKRPNKNTVYTLYIEDSFARMHYRNVFCYLCNNPKHINSTASCKDPEESTEPKGPFVKFSAVINLYQEESTVGTAPAQCKSVEIWDPFEAVCRSLLCPSGTIPMNGKCRSASLYTHGFSVSVIFEIVSTEGKDILIQNHYYFLTLATHVIMKSLGQDFHCGLCSVRLIRYKDETKTYIEFPFFTKKSCSKQRLIETLRDLVLKRNTTVTMNSKNKSVSYILKAVMSERSREMQNQILRDSSDNKRFCLQVMQLSYLNILSCPSINLTKQEYNKLNLSQSSQIYLHDGTTFINSTTSSFQVCVDEYLLLREIALTRNGCEQTGVFIPALYILLFCYFAICQSK